MKKIKVFIVGSTNLKQEFLNIKATANELNKELYPQFQVTFFSHDIGNEEATFLKFIMDEADIVLVVLKDKIGVFTEKEYRTAINSYKASKGKHPKTFVFLHSYKEKTDDISYIEKLMNEIEGDVFYKEYTEETLAYKVRKCIIDYLPTKPRRVYLYLSIAVILLAIFSLFFFINPDTNNDFVDLGLPSGTLWCKYNLGADNEMDYGQYYAWGNPNPLSYQIKQDSSKLKEGNIIKTKFDAAYNIGKGCLPSKEQFKELMDCCYWEKKDICGKTVFYVYGKLKNGERGKEYLCFPLPGNIQANDTVHEEERGYYWTGESKTNNLDSAIYVHIYSENTDSIRLMYIRKNCVLSIRPVKNR